MNNFILLKKNSFDIYCYTKKEITDERGNFHRLYCQKELSNILDKKIKQINISENLNIGTIRGMHFQIKNFSETKIVTVLQGKIFDVIVDIRKKSKNYMKYFHIELDDKKNISLIIPPGFAHGYQVLKKNTKLIYLHTNFYNKKFERSLNPLDPKLNIKWPIKKKIISEKDLNVSFVSKKI